MKQNKKMLTIFLISLLAIIMIGGIAAAAYRHNKNSSDNTAGKTEESSSTASSRHGGKPQTSADTEENAKTSSASTTEAIEYTLSSEVSVILLQKGETYSPKITISPTTTKLLSWETNDSSVATVNSTGKITAKGDGTAILTGTLEGSEIKIYVNVLTASNLPSKSRSTVTMYNQDGKKLKYRLYRQNEHDYSSYDSYLAWHGCATCSVTTVLNAFTETYQDHDPAKVISTIEKDVVSSSAWQEHHVKRSLKRQMPPSLYGITSMLTHANVEANYVRSYEKSEAKEEMLAHLRTGNPVIIEVRKKSNVTGKSSERWTNSVHTMIFLGVYTNSGKVILCDSVNRSWYSGGQRAKVVDIDDPMEYMYPCTTFDKSMYYNKQSSDGGYILVN